MPAENQVKKVLMIARAFPPFLPVGHSIRVVKFIKYLPLLGWQPSVVTIEDQREYETMPKVGSESLLSEIQSQVQIYRTYAAEPSVEFLEKEKNFSRKNLFTAIIAKILGGARRWTFRTLLIPDRYITWIPFALRKSWLIVNDEKIDVIFVTCPPHSSTLAGAILKKIVRKPLVLDFRDDWIDTPWHQSKPAVFRIAERWLESWIVKTADKVILVTDWSRRMFIERYPGQPVEKFVLIPNGVDLDEFRFLNSAEIAPPNPRFTIVHAGSLNESKSWGRNAMGFFQAIHELILEQPGLADKLRLVFAGDLPEEHRKMVDELALSGVIQAVGHLPHKEVLGLIKSADLLLAINYEGWSTLIPAKIYEYWAIARAPILLLSCPGAAQELIEQRSLGLSVSPNDPTAIKQAILKIYQSTKTNNPIKISTVGLEAFDRKVLTAKLVEILTELATNSKVS